MIIKEFQYFYIAHHLIGGHTTFCGFLNSGIHVVMYLYYFLAALGPKVQGVPINMGIQ